MVVSELFYDLGRYFGLAAFWSLALLIFSGDLARYFDRFFGLDRIIKFQRKFSLFATIIAVLHPTLFVLSTGNIKGYFIPNPSFPALAAGIVALYIFIAYYIASKLYKRISNSAWQYLHIISYLLFFLALYHALNWGSDSDKPLVKAAYFITVAAIAAAIAYRTAYKLRKWRAGSFHVVSISDDTHDTFTVSIKKPGDFPFKAGQFCFLRIDRDRLYARHPFTVSSAPSDDFLTFTIKDTGAFTRAARKLRAGDKLSVEGPYGRFYLRDDDKDLLFIAGGVGITPFLSMLKELANRNEMRKISLIYAVRTEKDIVAKDFLDGLSASGTDVTYALSQECKADRGFFEGRIDKELLKSIIKNPNRTKAYICGPEGLKDASVAMLHDIGVSRKNIFIEDFFW